VKCVIPGIEEFTTAGMRKVDCIEQNLALETYSIITDVLNVFSRRPLQFGCWVPCRQSTYKFELKFIHKNSLMGFVSEVIF
jgi:hypothetical protein